MAGQGSGQWGFSLYLPKKTSILSKFRKLFVHLLFHFQSNVQGLESVCESLDVCLFYQSEISFHLLTMWILKGTRRHFATPAMPFMNERISVTVWAFYLCFSFPALLCSQLHFRECMCKQVASWGRFRSCFNAWGAEFYRRAAWKLRL